MDRLVPYAYLGLTAIAVLIWIAGCADKAAFNHSDGLSINFNLRPHSDQLVAQLSTFEVTVTAFDIDPPLVFPLTYDSGIISGPVRAPIGPHRRFLVEAADADGTVLYRGRSTLNVVAGPVQELEVDLFPAVPLFSVSPRLGTADQGDPFFIDINATNITQIAYLEMAVNYRSDRIVFNEGDTSAFVPGDALPDQTAIEYNEVSAGPDGGNLFVSMDSRGLSQSLLSDSAETALFKLKFNSFWPGDTITTFADFSINIMALENVNGDTLVTAGFYSDDGRVQLLPPVFDSAHGGNSAYSYR